MGRSITIRFKDGVPVSNAKDPKVRREAEAFGAAFLAAAKEGRSTLHVVMPNPNLTDDAREMASELLAMLPPGISPTDLTRVRVSDESAVVVHKTPKTRWK